MCGVLMAFALPASVYALSMLSPAAVVWLSCASPATSNYYPHVLVAPGQVPLKRALKDTPCWLCRCVFHYHREWETTNKTHVEVAPVSLVIIKMASLIQALLKGILVCATCALCQSETRQLCSWTTLVKKASHWEEKGTTLGTRQAKA